MPGVRVGDEGQGWVDRDLGVKEAQVVSGLRISFPARRMAALCARGRVSKFQPGLSERQELNLLADAVTNVEGACEVVQRGG